VVYEFAVAIGMATALGRSRTQKIMNENFESTYALLVRSEEKGRSVLETVLYAIFILSVTAGIWQFAQTPVKVSAPGIERCDVCEISAPQNPGV